MAFNQPIYPQMSTVMTYPVQEPAQASSWNPLGYLTEGGNSLQKVAEDEMRNQQRNSMTPWTTEEYNQKLAAFMANPPMQPPPDTPVTPQMPPVTSSPMSLYAPNPFAPTSPFAPPMNWGNDPLPAVSEPVYSPTTPFNPASTGVNFNIPLNPPVERPFLGEGNDMRLPDPINPVFYQAPPEVYTPPGLAPSIPNSYRNTLPMRPRVPLSQITQVGNNSKWGQPPQASTLPNQGQRTGMMTTPQLQRPPQYGQVAPTQPQQPQPYAQPQPQQPVQGGGFSPFQRNMQEF